jgi:GTP-binding protein Era
MQNQKTFKSAFVALIGRPNSGKSTLMNTVLQEQLSVVTPLPQTTRRNLKGILTTDDFQLVFVDTPGIHQGKHVFNQSMIKEARTVLEEQGIDIICYIVDLSRKFGEEETSIANMISNSTENILIVFNKIDLVDAPEKKIQHFFELFPQFSKLPRIQISANLPEARKKFLDALDPFLSEGPCYFDPEELTDANLRFFAAEFIRKQIILNTREEVPHACFVEIESYKEEQDKHRINATIHVETSGQRGIIVGKGGSVITRIRKNAEKEMASLVQMPVSITCHIKVSPKWRDNEGFLKHMGLPVK